MSLPAIRYPDPPAQIAPYYDVLGPEVTIRFLLHFGGAQLYLPQSPSGRSAVAQLIGSDKLKQLAQQSEKLSGRVPLGNIWLAAALAAEGKSISEIARTLRASDVTVRGWLKRARKRMAEGKRV